MNKAKILILHYVHDLKMKVEDLFRDDLAVYTNLPHHGLCKEALKEEIKQLLKSDLIALDRHASHIDFSPNNWDAMMKSYYGLTNKGGAVWETIFVPNWDMFYLHEEQYLSEDKVLHVITYSSEELLAFFCGNLKKEDMLFSRLTNWSPVYWKKLPYGYAATAISDSESCYSTPAEWFDTSPIST